MIVHLAFESEYTHAYNEMIRRYFNVSEHLFLLSQKSSWDNTRSFNFYNSFRVDSYNTPDVIKLLNSCDGIVAHGLFNHEVVDVLYNNKPLIDKTIWLLWGGDLYMYREAGSALNSYAQEEKRKAVIKNLPIISCLVKGDYEIAKQYYGSKAQYKKGTYPFLMDFKYLNKYKNVKNNSSEIRILLGNSATETNCSIEAIQMLSKFKDENIKIYAPLSYGDKSYAERVSEVGARIFGNKFIPIFDFLSPDKYSDLLSTIDIAVMNHNRQQGLGSIIGLLYLGKKVYMRQDIASFSHFTEKGGVLFNVNDIPASNFKTFISYDSKAIQRVAAALIEDFSLDNLALVWRDVFYTMKKFPTIDKSRSMNEIISVFKRKYFPGSTFVGRYEENGYSCIMLEQWLWHNRKYIKGNVLDMSTPRYWHEFIYNLDAVTNVLISELDSPEVVKYGKTSKADIVGDFCGSKPLLPAESMDTILCVSILEHCEDIFAMVRNLTAILKPGGVIFFQTPYAYTDGHCSPDFWRIGVDGYKLLAKKFDLEIIELLTYDDIGELYESILGDSASADGLHHGVPVGITCVCRKPGIENKDEENSQSTISVIIPTYNRDALIEQAVKSIQAQTIPVSEIIIVDDASTDNTAAVVSNLKANDQRIKYIRLEKNSGAQVARNTGIKNASSEWISFLDSDDVWLPQRVENALKAAEYNSADVVYSNYIRRDPDGTETPANPPQFSGSVYTKLLEGSFVTFPGLFVRRECFRETGFLDESIKSMQEWDEALKLSKKYLFAYDNEPGFIWIWHDGETISKDNKRWLVGNLQIIIKYKDDILKLCGNACMEHHLNFVLNQIKGLEQTEDIIFLKEQVLKLKASLTGAVTSPNSTDSSPIQNNINKNNKENQPKQNFNVPTPWSWEYVQYRELYNKHIMENQGIINLFRSSIQLPDNYAIGLDERSIEYPWFFSTRNGYTVKRILDAGSALNHPDILQNKYWEGKELTILTLAPESRNYEAAWIKRIYADLRSIPSENNYFDEIVCISTLEHVGMDNTLFTGKESYNEKRKFDFLKALKEMNRVLKPGGKLFLTVPFGKHIDYGEFQQFDLQMLDKGAEEFGAVKRKQNYYYYSEGGWKLAEDPTICSHMEYARYALEVLWGSRTSNCQPEADGAAAARAVACCVWQKGS